LSAINTRMPAISRHRDKCATGHTCNTTAPVLASQFTVFANGKPILVKGNRVAPHTIKNPSYPPSPPPCIQHPNQKLSGGSSRVFVKGIGVGRKGDRADFGAMIAASTNVFAG